MKNGYLKVFCLILAGLACFVIYGGIESRKPAKTPRPRTTTEHPAVKPAIEYEKDPHYAAALGWRNAAQHVADVTQDADAKRVMGYFRTSVGFGLPGTNSVTIIYAPPDGASGILIVPILRQDEELDVGLKKINNSQNTMALFRPEARVIALRSEPMSDVWKGVLLLHEGRHALSYSLTHYDSADIRQLCYEERDTLEFQDRIVAKLGGETYANVLRAEIDRLRSQLAAAGLALETKMPPRGGYQPVLETAFGPAETDLERASRQTQLWTHAAFTLIDEDYRGSDKEDFKAHFIQGVYVQLGVQQ